MTPLTEWEIRKRAVLLASEKPELRAIRLEAENPDTPADALERLANEVDAWTRVEENRRDIYRDKRDIGRDVELISEALAAHPNTPPSVLAHLLNGMYRNERNDL